MHNDTASNATDQVLALVRRAREPLLVSFGAATVNAAGIFHHPATQLATLKAARDNIEKAIAVMERKWGK